MKRTAVVVWFGLAAIAAFGATAAERPTFGSFEDHADVGEARQRGSVRFDPAALTYAVTGGGDNMWFAKDALHFVWTQMLGDISLTADIRWPTPGGNPHRKAVLLIRQTLEPDSAYASATLHGNGLTSLQYREVRGGPTREIQSSMSAPQRLRITREGDYVFMSIAREGEGLRPAGGSFRIKLREPFMVGLGVCAGDHAAMETAEFSRVEINTGRPAGPSRFVLESTLETVAVASKERRVVLTARERFAAPFWSSDGKALLYRRGAASSVFTVPASGGEPRRHTAPGGGPRAGASSDGRHLYFGSERPGTTQVRRTRADGTEPVAVTDDPFPNCFPQPSPDGKWLLVLSYEEGVKGCPANKDVTLRLLPLAGGEVLVLAKLFGGRGTIDLPPWSPDSAHVAFVSYRLAAP